MSDRIEGYLDVGQDDSGNVVVNLPADMTGHIKFSPNQARTLAGILTKHAGEIDRRLAADAERRRLEQIPPVDRTARTLTDGSPVTPDHTAIDPATGMQKGYVVLSDAERAKGFVRPVRRTYFHKACGTETTMGQTIAETYARDPSFYGGTFCVKCGTHFPLLLPDGTRAFAWDDGTGVGE